MSLAAAVAALLFFYPQAGQAQAASRPGEGYNPKTDPNYTQGARQNVPADWQVIWGSVQEFGMQPGPPAERRQGATPYGLPQPRQYADTPDPSTPPQLVPGGLVYQSLYGFPTYPYGGWHPGWWDASPRIPWWSLIPFTRHGRDRGWDH
jgi:hypothetical protein